MAFSFQPLDQALDSLGFSYVDGVTVTIAPKYRLDCDLKEVQQILSKPAPSVLAFDSHYDISYEKQVLEDIDSRAKAADTRKTERRQRIEAYELKKKEKVEQRKKEEEEKALEDERNRLLEIEKEKKAKWEAQQQLIEEERKMLEVERKRKEEEEALIKKQEEEDEWKKFDEERCRRDSINCDKSEETEDSCVSEFTTPPQEPKTPEEHQPQECSPQAVNNQPPPSSQNHQTGAAEIVVKGIQNQNHPMGKINFSDFESTSDPFTNLELKSINDLAELQTILGNATSSSVNVAPSQNHHPVSQHNVNAIYTPASYQSTAVGQSPSYLNSSLTPSQELASRLAQTSNYGGYNSYGYNHPNQFYYNQIPNTSQTFSTPHPHAYPQQHNVANTKAFTVYNQAQDRSSTSPSYQSAPGSSAVRSVSSERHRTEKLKDSSDDQTKPCNGELKPSRSMGDMISELQKEVEELQQQKKKSPSSRPSSRGATGLENWTPWPQLDQENVGTRLVNGNASADTKCLDGLSSEDKQICLQLHEMGFPLARLAKGVTAVGANSQKLINFCLVVDRLVDEGFNVEACEDVVMLHNADEEVCRKHLRSFQQIAEIGFPSRDVHQALIASSFDHQKALDQLIR